MSKLSFHGLSSITDDRAPSDRIINGAPIHLRYTFMQDDITTGKKPNYTPYEDRKGFFVEDQNGFYHEETDTRLRVCEYKDGLCFSLVSNRSDLSEFGLSFPFNFIGKLNGGAYTKQFLFNSPYVSKGEGITYAYLTQINGNHLLAAVISENDGWKMDYSQDAYGHFFDQLNFYANFDQAYGTKKRKNELKVVLLPVDGFEEALSKLSDIYGRPFLSYDVSGGEKGTVVRLTPYGKVDELLVNANGKMTSRPFEERFVLDAEGEIFVTPVYQGRKGSEISLYAYSSLKKLYKRSMDSVNLSVIKNYTDGNLCEHQSWASAMLRFLLNFKQDLTEKEIACYEEKLRDLLAEVRETDENKAIYRRTIFAKPYMDFPAYHVFGLDRIQEQAFGVTFLLDAYRYFGEEEILLYAENSLDTLIDTYQDDDGGLKRRNGHDYSTVCCPMIPIVDMANFLKDKDPIRAEKYKESAKKLAAHIYRRGFTFPTETAPSKNFEEVAEEGSVSCSALSLLYYAKNVQRTEKYIVRAKEILDLHEAWVIRTPLCQAYCSTLRWWETIWEGDQDGPAICAGHAWTIWRAEADWLYYSLTGNEAYKLRAWNGFVSNLSKIQKDGKSFANYHLDLITGGGSFDRADNVRFRLTNRFPDREDCGLSRYVWIRLNETFLRKDKKEIL